MLQDNSTFRNYNVSIALCMTKQGTEKTVPCFVLLLIDQTNPFELEEKLSDFSVFN